MHLMLYVMNEILFLVDCMKKYLSDLFGVFDLNKCVRHKIIF